MVTYVVGNGLLVSLMAMIFPLLLHWRWFDRLMQLELKRVRDRANWTHPDGCPLEAEEHYNLAAFLRSRHGELYRASGWTMILAGAAVGDWHGISSLAAGSMAAYVAALIAAYVAFVRYLNLGP